MTHVTAEQRATYEKLGTVHIPGAVDSRRVARLTQIIDDVIARVRAGTMPAREHPDPVFHDIEIEDHDGYVRIINIMPDAPEIREWILGSDLPEIVADVIGAEHLRLWLDGTFSKVGAASETATPWHNDECTFSFQGEQMPSLWIGLTDVDETNSPLVTLAGSHRDEFRYHSPYAPQEEGLPAGFRPWSDLLEKVHAKDADKRVWTTRAGDILLIHPRTIHASLPRTTEDGGRRLAFTVRWIGSDVLWKPTPLTRLKPFDHHPLMQEGKPPPDELFPVVWRRGFAAG